MAHHPHMNDQHTNLIDKPFIRWSMWCLLWLYMCAGMWATHQANYITQQWVVFAVCAALFVGLVWASPFMSDGIFRTLAARHQAYEALKHNIPLYLTWFPWMAFGTLRFSSWSTQLVGRPLMVGLVLGVMYLYTLMVHLGMS